MSEYFHNVKASTQYKREHKADYGREKIEILYQDDDIVVINKASGLLSVPYPGSKSRTALQVLEKIIRKKPYVVHRLDRDTSGVMMFALSEQVQKRVMNSWQRMVTGRLYHAVAENPRKPSLEKEGIIDEPLAKNAYNVGYVPHDKNDHAKTVAARTHYKIIEEGPTHTLFELELDTGKKNQIRAHLASKHYPLAGDENYRAKTDPFGRLALHARTLEFVHPTNGKMMKFEVPEDKEWLEYVKKGDKEAKTAIWNQKQPKQVKENAPEPEYISRKTTRKMDFISRGKMKGKF